MEKTEKKVFSWNSFKTVGHKKQTDDIFMRTADVSAFLKITP